ncbi:MAG: VanW family protein [Thermomicrobiaceae bacterium]|nr:VanW family protein [Thermomicrobiaceae bacterium]
MRFEPRPAEAPKLAVTVDPAGLADALKGLAGRVETPARDANLRWLDGQVKVVTPEQVGVTLDVDGSGAAIRDGLLSGKRSVALVTKKVQPKVTAAMAGSIKIREKLSSAQTYYGGSVSNRKFNVELAVQRANGALIPPGGTFSFVGAVGAVDLNHGYRVGYGIVGTSNGSVSTVPSVGGGICQVATTAFQAAFWAGMPIVERNWHLYWIPSYGQPPSGLTGLDATVDTDYGLDMKFKNTTNDWLAFKAVADGQWVRFELWGTNPHWRIEVDDPVVTNVVKTDTKMQYQKTDQLPAGSSVLVEHAQDGFSVSIHRRVYAGDKLIDDLTLKSQYRPSHNVTLVGTG